MDLTIAIVSWNTRELLRRCLASIDPLIGGDGEGLRVEVIVVDNGSADGSAELVAAEFPRATLIRNRDNRGFAGANNQAIAASQGRHVLLLNSDAVLVPGAAETMVGFLDSHPGVGAVGVQLVNADGSFQASFADFPSLLGELLLLTKLSKLVCPPTYPSYPPEKSTVTRAVDWVVGACLMVRRRAIDEVGGLDEGYFMYTEETDWCYRLGKAGWPVYFLPEVRVPHWSGQSASKAPERKRSQLYRSKSRFFWKHRGRAEALTFDLAVRIVSLLKLGVWALGGTLGAGRNRSRARQHARSYARLLSEF